MTSQLPAAPEAPALAGNALDDISPAPIMDLINAFRRSKVMFTLVEAGVIDALHAAAPRGATAVELLALLNAAANGFPATFDDATAATAGCSASTAGAHAVAVASGADSETTTAVGAAASPVGAASGEWRSADGLDRLLRAGVALGLLLASPVALVAGDKEATAPSPAPSETAQAWPLPDCQAAVSAESGVSQLRYSLSPVAAKYLASCSPDSLSGYVVHSDRRAPGSLLNGLHVC